MLLGLVDISLWFPLSLVFVGINLSETPIRPYINWENVHANFSAVGFFFPAQIPEADRVIFELSRWMGPLTAFVFFIFFGLKTEIYHEFVSYFNKLFKLSKLTRKHEVSSFSETGDKEMNNR